MHRAALADEAAAEFLEDPVGLHQDSPEPVDVVRIVGAVDLVLVETDRVGNFVRLVMDLHVQAQLAHLIHEPGVERSRRLRLQCHAGSAAVASLHDQFMVHEIEVDLERRAAVGNR